MHIEVLWHRARHRELEKRKHTAQEVTERQGMALSVNVNCCHVSTESLNCVTSNAEVLGRSPDEACVLCSRGLAPMPRAPWPSGLGAHGPCNVVNDGDLPGHSHKDKLFNSYLS